MNYQSLDAHVIANIFLQLVHIQASHDSKQLLYSLEPELRWANGVLAIPRIVYDPSPNGRLNS